MLFSSGWSWLASLSYQPFAARIHEVFRRKWYDFEPGNEPGKITGIDVRLSLI